MISIVALIGYCTAVGATLSQYNGFPGTQVLGFPEPQVLALPGSRVPSFPGFQVPGFPGSEDSGFPSYQDPGFPGSQVPGFPGSQVPGFPGSQVPGFPGSQVPGFPGSQFPGIPGSQATEFPGFPGYPQVSPQIPLPISMTRSLYIPPYTNLLKDFVDNAIEIRQHIPAILGDDSNSQLTETHPIVQYATIVHVVDQLIVELTKHLPYSMVYAQTVTNSLLEAASNPVSIAKDVLTRLQKTSSKTAVIRSFIKLKQQECMEPYSSECDMLIDMALETSNDPLLKSQAKLLVALSPMMKLFKQTYASEFEDVAKTHRAEAYLTNGYNRLKPFVMAGAEARELGLSVRSGPVRSGRR